MNIAVIPARGGSKRIPRKNIKWFLGKPMIAYAISVAKETNVFDRVIVSTDDQEVARTAVEYGAEVPFTRPLELADEYTPTVPVIAHAIKECTSYGWRFENVCCIYPCVPFLTANDVKLALETFEISGSNYCFPITEYSAPVHRALQVDSAGNVSPANPKFELTRSQDLSTLFHDAGQFYWGKKESWLKVSNIHSNAVGFVIPKWRVVDIDKPDDWRRAELMYQLLNQES